MVSRKRAHYKDCPPISQVSLGFLQRSKTYLKERPFGARIADRELPLSNKDVAILHTTTRCKLHSASGLH